jgi:hypothetical protein
VGVDYEQTHCLVVFRIVFDFVQIIVFDSRIGIVVACLDSLRVGI